VTPFLVTEPSGRATSKSGFGLDPAYPRNIVRDRTADVSAVDLPGMLNLTGRLRYAGDGTAVLKPTEWISPWRYPSVNQAAQAVPQERTTTHVGPFVAGDRSILLLPGPPGDTGARNRLEDCRTPAETFAQLESLLPLNLHLGGPVDYGLYLVGYMVVPDGPDEFRVPDFNLDSDRGYGWLCWDWDRHHLGPTREWECVPPIDKGTPSDFAYRQPCAPPQFFHADHDNPHQLGPDGEPLDSQWFDPRSALRAHYLGRQPEQPPPPDGDDPCDATAQPRRPADDGDLAHPGAPERGGGLRLGRRGDSGRASPAGGPA
jgi:hypothetical protein